MRIAKPLLLVTTPLGVVTGLHEAYMLTGGMVILMAMMIGLLSVAAASVVMTIRRESALHDRHVLQTPRMQVMGTEHTHEQ